MNKKLFYFFSTILWLLAITVIVFTVLLATGVILDNGADPMYADISQVDSITDRETVAEMTVVTEPDTLGEEIPESEEEQPIEREEALEYSDMIDGSGEIIDDESYDRTVRINERDLQIVESSTLDLSDKKITILGDSLTVGYPEEEVKGDNFPNTLQSIFNCEVVNLGITGSTITKAHKRSPMCERWQEIDKDSDIIIVYAGTNDMMMVTKEQFGEVGQEKTFCGDLEAMLSGIAAEYPDAVKIVINPAVSGYCRAIHEGDPDNTYTQEPFSDMILERAAANGFEIVDLYSANMFNANNRDVLDAYYLYDCLHLSPNGYHVLANHVAAKIISIEKNK